MIDAVPLLTSAEREWSLPDPAARIDLDEAAGLQATWPDGLVLTLTRIRHRSGDWLRCQAWAPGVIATAVGVRLFMDPAPQRILVDGYHSWDWAGVRDASSEGSGWWGAIWGHADGGLDPVTVRPAVPPVQGALHLRWREGSLDAMTTGEPDQAVGRTGPPTPLRSEASRTPLVADAIAIAGLDRTDRLGSGLPHPSSRARTGRLVGWMSWNCLGDRVDAASARAAAGLVPRGGVVLVDDGWERSIGDWHERPEFGGTIDSLAADLRESGHRLGLWVAPFLVAEDTSVVRRHPEWLLRDREGHPVVDQRPPAPRLVLDASHPEVLGRLERLGHRLGSAGVSVLKADFLYAAALPAGPTGGAGMRRLREGLQALVSGFHAAAPGATVLACGAPGPAVVGLADACRSGPDAVLSIPSPGAEPPPRPWFVHGIPVVRAQIRNFAARSWLWGTTLQPDVDAVTLGAVGETPPADDESLDAWIALARRSGGPFLVSDTATGLTPERRERLLEELTHPRAGTGPVRPVGPLEMAPAPMAEDDVLSWQSELPRAWEDAAGSS